VAGIDEWAAIKGSIDGAEAQDLCFCGWRRRMRPRDPGLRHHSDRSTARLRPGCGRREVRLTLHPIEGIA
jgi:hypothetical protein